MALAVESTATASTRARHRTRIRHALLAGLFLLPALAFLLTFVYVPSFMAFSLAFFHYHLMGVNTTSAGWSNFSDAISFNIFQQSLGNTFFYAAMMIPSILLVSMGIALLINRATRFYAVLRTLVLLPYATPAVGTAIGWLWIFDPTYGLANAVLHVFHIPPQQWLQSPAEAMPSIALYSLWHGVGFDVIIVMAALASVPRTVLEAAAIDGANAWRRFWTVTVPLISPTLFFITVITTIGTLQSFSQIFALTGGNGGPEYATTTTLFLIYETAFVYNHYSYASAMAILLVIIILALTIFQRTVGKRLVFYQ
jgi:multiple sugar transport system permease protein